MRIRDVSQRTFKNTLHNEYQEKKVNKKMIKIKTTVTTNDDDDNDNNTIMRMSRIEQTIITY